MRKTELQDLLKVIETLRMEKHPDLDARFLEAVVTAEEMNPEDNDEALLAIESALKRILKTKAAV